MEAAFFPTENDGSRVFLSSYHYDFYFIFLGVATITIKAALEYKPPLIISRILSLLTMIEAAASIQENAVLSKEAGPHT